MSNKQNCGAFTSPPPPSCLRHRPCHHHHHHLPFRPPFCPPASSHHPPLFFFFFSFSTSLNAFHLAAKLSASALSSVMMILSKIVPPFTCHKSKPMNPKSSYLSH